MSIAQSPDPNEVAFGSESEPRSTSVKVGVPAEPDEELLAELPAEALPLDALALEIADALLDELPAEGGGGAGGGGVGPVIIEELLDAELLIPSALPDETAELAVEDPVEESELGAGLLIATGPAGLSASLAPHETSKATTAGAATIRTHGVGARIVVLPRRHLHSRLDTQHGTYPAIALPRLGRSCAPTYEGQLPYEVESPRVRLN